MLVREHPTDASQDGAEALLNELEVLTRHTECEWDSEAEVSEGESCHARRSLMLLQYCSLMCWVVDVGASEKWHGSLLA